MTNPTSSDEAMVSPNSICCGHKRKTPELETAGTGVRAARQKSCYLLVLFMAMPEAWRYLVYLWVKLSPKNMHHCGSVKYSDISPSAEASVHVPALLYNGDLRQ